MSECFSRLLIVALTLCSLAANAAENTRYASPSEDDEGKPWQEEKVEYPAPPEEANQVSIDLGPTHNRRYWVDKTSVNIGKDGVVRYSLTVQSSGGVRGVTYEGIRCETRELRRYAVLKGPGEWSRSRNEAWKRITESPGDRQHAILYLYHFCTDGIVVKDIPSALRNLQRGGRFPGESPVAY